MDPTPFDSTQLDSTQLDSTQLDSTQLDSTLNSESNSSSRLRLAELNPAQREAVESIEGPLLILAGPGSGKTRVITHRIARMLERGIPAHSIAALTFTNKAAGEMRDRLALLAPGQQVWSGTFHRFCSRLLRAYASLVGLSENFTIYDTSDSRKLLKQAIEAAEVDLRHYNACCNRPTVLILMICCSPRSNCCGKIRNSGSNSTAVMPTCWWTNIRTRIGSSIN
jgi:hypothetical protein